MATTLAAATTRPAPSHARRVSTPRPAPRRATGAPKPARGASRRILAAASSDDAAASPALSASLSEVAEHDKLIDKLLAADGAAQLAQLVAENLMAFDQKFWIRVAARADTAPAADKDRLASLASAVMGLVDAAVQRTDTQLSAAGEVLQRILAAGADERGEWHLPLAPDRIAAMRAALDDAASGPGGLDEEALLSNAFAWMRKASDDGQAGLVRLLQRALQLYAARALGGCEGEDDATTALAAVADAEEEEWEGRLKSAGLSPAGFEAAIRRRMEAVVLGLPSGSYAQRVQAEYLKEVERAGSAALGLSSGGE